MSQQEKIKFIVKNGRYAGSVIELDQDHEYSLGRSFHCDIAIDDPRFAERQMLLKVGADGVQIKLLAEGKLAVDGAAKDTNAQSEWRNMDPRSIFVMNDLEFSFEVPEALYAGMQRHSAVQSQREMAAVTELDEAVDIQSKSQSKSQSSGASSRTTSTHHNFDELETQVPGEDGVLEESDVQIQVVPSLADELDFDTGSEIRYKKNLKSQSQQKRNYENQKYIIWGSVAGLFVIVAAYYYMGYEPAQDSVSQSIESKTIESGLTQSETLDQQKSAADADEQTTEQANDGFTPFVMQDNSTDSDLNQSEFTDTQYDDPFMAYDRMKQDELTQQENSTQGASSQNEVSQNAEPAQKDMSELQKNLDALKMKNAQTVVAESEAQNNQNKVLSKPSEEIETETLAKIDAIDQTQAGTQARTDGQSQKSGKPATLYFDESSADDQSFGKLSEDQAEKLSQSDGKQQKTHNNQGSSSDSMSSSNNMLAVMNGSASPSTIVIPAAKDLLDGLGLGYLVVSTRQPRQDEVAPVVVVRGYVDNRQTWMRAKAILTQDIQEIGTLADNVSSPEVRKAQLDRWIDQSDIKGKVQTYLSDRGLIAKINLNPSQIVTWQAISKQYVKKFDNQPALFVMKDPGDWLKIRSISFGDRPYLVTQDGAVLLPGAKLGNGYSIVAIRRSGIELRDQFGTYTYVF